MCSKQEKKPTMRMVLRTLLLAGATVAAASVMKAQTAVPQPRHEVDLAILYTAERSNLVTNPIFWREGGAFTVSAELYHGFGVGLDVDGSRSSDINGSGVNLTSITTTIGPRYEWSRRSGKISIFGEGLFGNSHGADSVFPSVHGAKTDYDSFALQVGGGLDLRLGHRLSIRPIQADWVRTEFPNATTGVQNSLRLGAGIVLRLRGSKH
jgi:hypothetical protein